MGLPWLPLMRSSLEGQNCPFVECVATISIFFIGLSSMCQYLPLEVIVAVAMVTVNEILS